MPRKTFWVRDPRQIEALAHPARHEIMDRLVAMGPMSARELAAVTGRQTTTLYHHLEMLEELGLISVATVESSDRGRPYVVYKSKAPRLRMSRAAVRDPQVRHSIEKWARVVGREAAAQFMSALDSGNFQLKGAKRNMSLFRVVSAPSRERLKRINVLLDELVELVWTPDPEPGPSLSFAWFVSPLDHDPKGSSGRKS